MPRIEKVRLVGIKYDSKSNKESIGAKSFKAPRLMLLPNDHKGFNRLIRSPKPSQRSCMTIDPLPLLKRFDSNHFLGYAFLLGPALIYYS